MAAEPEALEQDEGQQQDFGAAEDWDAPGEPGDLSSLSAQTEWLNQPPMVAPALVFCTLSDFPFLPPPVPDPDCLAG
jgi:hypothetical protein